MTLTPRPIRVLHTLRTFRVDGVVVNLRRILAHIDRERFEHRVAYLMPAERLRESFQAMGIHPVHLAYRGPASAPATVLRIMRYLRAEHIELVHTNATLDYVLFGIAARLCGIPVVASLHWLGGPEGGFVKPRRSPLQGARDAIRGQVDRRIATRIVAVSAAVRDTHARWMGLPVSKTEVVYPGLELGEWKEKRITASAGVRQELWLSEASAIVSCVGRLVRGKGQEHLIAALPRVLETYPDLSALIVGDGPCRADLEATVRANPVLAHAVHFLGWRTDVDRLIAASDVFVLPSDTEAAPLPVLEAMKAGTPIVATRVGGVPEMVTEGESAFMVPRGDPDALADALLRMLASPERMRAMGVAARRGAEARFTAERQARELERIYRSVLAGDDAPARRTAQMQVG